MYQKNRVEEMLRNQGVKPSYPRMRIMSYLLENKTHPTVDEIYVNLLSEIPTLSKTTVYNTLGLFKERGLVQLLTIEEGEARYDADVGLHIHFQCNKCGKVYDFYPEAQMVEFGLPKGFEITEKHIYFKGICPSCEGDKEKPVLN